MTTVRSQFSGLLALFASALGACSGGYSDEEQSVELGVVQQAMATAWTPNTAYGVTDQVLYDGTTYQAVQAHTSQIGWEPPNTPALWTIPAGAEQWAPQTTYSVGDVVTYQGVSYTCLQAHQSLVGWHPPATPALWQAGGSAEPFELLWPMPGQDGLDWVINNYVDLDRPGGTILDYRGGSKSIPDHLGVDVDVPTFRSMDADYEIVAAAAGEVVALHEAEFDRNLSCVGFANFVNIRSDNGYLLRYLHFKQNSITPRVNLGDRVEAGDPIGVVGSSGCSTQPHLHLETFDPSGNLVDPFLEGLWIDPPVYDTPASVMDIVVTNEPLNNVQDVFDPPANLSSFVTTELLRVGISAAGGDVGDTITTRVRLPNGTINTSFGVTYDQVLRHPVWIFNHGLPSGHPVSGWLLEVLVNGMVVRTHAFEVQ